MLINSSYGIQDYQIIGGPDWLRTERFDVDAIVEVRPLPPNLTDSFDWELTWTPDLSTGDGSVPDAVSIFTALQEQLGLKLEPARGPLDVLVIDSVDRPTEN